MGSPGIARPSDVVVAPESLEASVEFRVLGPMEYRVSGQAQGLGGPKQRAVLSLLVKDIGKGVSSDALIDGVWGEDPPAAVLTSLHSYVSNLRSILAGRIERTGDHYLLAVDPSAVDANLFERDVSRSRASLTANPLLVGQTLRTALALWRGHPYADLVDVPGLQAEIRRLEELRLQAVEARIDADMAMGNHESLIGELEALATEHPFREAFRGRHMLALYRTGRQAEALRAYQLTREYLADDLGVDPSPELQGLEQRILVQDPALLSSADVRTETVAFLFVDVVNSADLWEAYPELTGHALARLDKIVETSVEELGGRIFTASGESACVAFGSVSAAVDAATRAQRSTVQTDWGDLGQLEVRMSVDIGEVDAQAGDYYGAPLNRGARLLKVAHGGQILLSASAHEGLRQHEGIQVLNLGEHRLRGVGEPQVVFQLVAPGLESDFPVLRLESTDSLAVTRFGDALRGYEIRHRIGGGHYSVVYRAYQPGVGREVAIKMVRPEHANHPAFVRRFEAESRLVAKLDHPHIVSLYDFWRDHEGAYLVMPYLVGIRPGDDPMTVLHQIASALSYAHRRGVIHRYVKPSNVLFDDDGNAYLADFGIALPSLEAAVGFASSGLAYRAPEVLAGDPVDERTDVFGLGTIAAELMTGQSLPGIELSVLPDETRTAIEKALDVHPDRRFRSVDEFIDALAYESATDVPKMPRWQVRNPYKGLAAFDEADCADFFGRSSEVDALLRLVADHRFVTVVGPSGSGKSSLVQAGLIPRLRSSGMAGGSEWLIARTVPGDYPFDRLATALGELATESLGDLVAELRSDEHGLSRVCERLLHGLDGDLLIVVDQFEELYSLVSDRSSRNAYIAALVEATTSSEGRVRVVATIRADFFDHPLLDERLSGIVSNAHLALAVPGPGALLEAVERPAAGAGVTLEAQVAQRIVADVRDEPGGLPLMQYVLTDLVERTRDGVVGLVAYEESGGVAGALARRATATYAEFDARDQDTVEQIFVRLLNVSDDADDVRRRVRKSELESLGLESPSVNAVLSEFGRARLLIFDRDPITRGPTVEVAHEALLREWDLLRSWIAARREALLVHRRFRAECAAWESRDRATDQLPSGGRLAAYEEWAADSSVRLSDGERELLDAAIEVRTEAAEQRRSRRNRILAGFGAAALVAALLAAVAWVQRGSAQRSATLAEARALVFEGESALEFDPELSLHLGLDAAAAFQESGDVPASAVDLLRNGIAGQRVLRWFEGGRFVAVAPDGSEILTAGERGAVAWDLRSGERLGRFGIEGAAAIGAAYSPDGAMVAVSFMDIAPAIAIFDRAGEILHRLDDEPSSAFFRDLEFSADSELLTTDSISASGTPQVQVWSLSGENMVLEGEDDTWGPTFLSDGLLGYVVEERAVRIRDVSTGEVVREYEPSIPTGWFAHSPDGSLLAVTNNVEVVVLDTQSGEEVAGSIVNRAGPPVWLPEGERFVVGGESVLRVLDARTGGVAEDLLGHEGGSLTYEVVPGTTNVISAGEVDGRALLFDASEQGPAEVAGWLAPVMTTWHAYWASDGERAVVADETSFVSARALDGAESWRVAGDPGADWFPTASDNGSFIMGSDASGRWNIWREDTSEVVYQAAKDWSIRGVSGDGSLAVVHLQEPERCTTNIIETESGEILSEIEAGCLGRATFSADGRVALASNLNGLFAPFATAVFDVATGELLGSLGREIGGVAAEITRDGSGLVVGTVTGEVIVFDLAALISGVPALDTVILRIPAHDTLVVSLNLSPDGSMAVSASWREPLRLWNLDTGELLGEFGDLLEGRERHDGSFHPTKPQLLVARPPNDVRIHTLDLDELIEIAQSRLTRDLTSEECELYRVRSCNRR